MSRIKILFVCNHNSARSQIAEYLLRHLYGERFDVYSAGATPAENINPLAVTVLQEVGIDTSDANPKNFHDLPATEFDYIVSVCDAKAEECPAMVFGTEPFNMGIPDPTSIAAATDNPDQKLQAFREALEKIRQIVRNLAQRVVARSSVNQSAERFRDLVESDFKRTIGGQMAAYMREATIINCPPGDEIICIQQSRLELIMQKELKELSSSDIWAWFGLTISLATTLLTATFQSTILTPDDWEVVFMVAFLVSAGFLGYFVYRWFKGQSKSEFIESVLEKSKGQQLFKE